MKRDDEVSWSRLGRIEKLFLVLMAIWALLYFTGMGQRYQMATALSAIFMGMLAIVKVGRMAMRNLIWRLRNRLIVAYLFIAVVPIVLILALMLVTSYALIGQMAVYLVNRELDNRMRTLSFPAETLDACAGQGSADCPHPIAADAAAGVSQFRNAGHRRANVSLSGGLQTVFAARAVEKRQRPDHQERRRSRTSIRMGALRTGRQRGDHSGADHVRTAGEPGAGHRRRHISRVHPATVKIARAGCGERSGYPR